VLTAYPWPLVPGPMARPCHVDLSKLFYFFDAIYLFTFLSNWRSIGAATCADGLPLAPGPWSDGAPACLPPPRPPPSHMHARMDGFCKQNADQLGSLAGISFPAVYVGVVECAPASSPPASSLPPPAHMHARRMHSFCNSKRRPARLPRRTIFSRCTCRCSRMRASLPLHILS
jgi:hypothetical protein